MEKYGRGRRATDGNTAHALGMLDNSGQRHAHNTQYLLLYHGNNGYANATQCYVYT